MPLLIAATLFATPAFSHLPIPPKKGQTGRVATPTPVADFSLVDQDGKEFRFAGARGKIVLVNFIYTSCPDVCPLLTAKFASIQKTLRERSLDDYLLLSISTDPERDSPAALKSYAESFEADFRHWLFLTGTKKRLQNVWKGLGVKVKKLPSGEVQHTTLTILIDQRGMRRVDYYGDRWQEKELLKDLASLAQSDGAAEKTSVSER